LGRCINRGDGGNVMSGKVFQKRAIDRNGGLDRKRELPPIEQPKRLTAPLVFGRGRAIYSKGSGDLRVSAVANSKKNGIEWAISFRFSHEVSELLGLKRGDCVLVSTDDGVVWKCDLTPDGFALTQQKGCYSKTLYLRAPVEYETVEALGLGRTGLPEDRIPALLCDLEARAGDSVTFRVTGTC
jgi:hypothetical protein